MVKEGGMNDSHSFRYWNLDAESLEFWPHRTGSLTLQELRPTCQTFYCSLEKFPSHCWSEALGY